MENQFDRLERYGLFLTVSRDPGTGALVDYAVRFGPDVGHCAAFNDSRFEPSLLPLRGRPYPRPGQGSGFAVQRLARPRPRPRVPAEPGEASRNSAGAEIATSSWTRTWTWTSTVPVRFLNPEVEADLETRPFPPAFRLDPKRVPTWSEVVGELSRHLPFALYSDDFAGTRDWQRQRVLPADLSRFSLAAGLDALCKAHDRLWWRSGDALFFRSRAWFYERRFEVPPPVQARLAEQIDLERGLTPAAFTTLSRLSLQQLQGLSAAAAFEARRRGVSTRERYGWYYYVRRAYPLLRFFGTLSERQKRLVFAEGLRPDDMSPAQREQFLFLAILSDYRDVLDDPAAVRLRIRSGPPKRPEQEGAPWIATASVGCRESGIHSPFAVLFTPPAPRNGTAR